MRIATFASQRLRQVGMVDADGSQLRTLPLSAAQARLGVLAVVEAAVAGGALPSAEGPALALVGLKLEAPLPLPRRNLFCVGRNYYAHAKELSASVFKDHS